MFSRVLVTIVILVAACRSHSEGDEHARRSSQHGSAAASGGDHHASHGSHHDHGHGGHGGHVHDDHQHGHDHHADDGGVLAMRYEPPTDETRIAHAQREVRKAPSVEAYLGLAIAFLEQRRIDGRHAHFTHAESALGAARRQAPTDASVRRTTALLRLDQHRFAEAGDLARQVVAERPSDVTAQLLLGDALLELGDYDAATRAFQRAIELRPDVRSYNRGAYMRWLYGDVEGAVELMHMALAATSPADHAAIAWCLVDLGTIDLRRGKSGDALAYADKALTVVAGYPPALRLRARAQRQLGNLAASLTTYRLLLSRDVHADDLLEAADVAQLAEQAEIAADYLAQAERQRADAPAALASYYARHALHAERTLPLVQQALGSVSPIGVWSAYSLALWRAGKTQDARAASERAMALGTKDAQLFLHRALIELAAGEGTVAQRQFAKALRLNPHVDPVLVAEFRRLETSSNAKDQYAFVRQLSARQAIRDTEQRAQALSELASAWKNKRYEWELRFLPSLCKSKDQCHLLPFDYARLGARVTQGWLPRLDFKNDKEFRVMTQACEDHAACIVRVRGVLSEVQASVELPTALTFSRVRFLGARAQRGSEAWVRSARASRVTAQTM